MRLKGDIVDRMRSVLGGKTPTEKRMKDLLEEVEALRAKQAKNAEQMTAGEVVADTAYGSVDISTAGSGYVATAQMPDRVKASNDAAGRLLQAFIPPGPDEELEDGGEAAGAHPALVADMAIMMATIKNLEAKVTELSKPRSAEDKDQAIGAGRLPIVVSEPAPVGYTGSAALPRGTWFTSPFGPKIQMKLCDCPQCSPFRLQHYFCVTCQKGPIDYQQHNPQGRKIWLAPGATWGISHEACSVVCYMRYMERLGIVAGVNEFQAPGQQAVDGPDRPVLALGSD